MFNTLFAVQYILLENTYVKHIVLEIIDVEHIVLEIMARLHAKLTRLCFAWSTDVKFPSRSVEKPSQKKKTPVLMTDGGETWHYTR